MSNNSFIHLYHSSIFIITAETISTSHQNLIYQFMNSKNPSTSSLSNNHFHYHLYQYQTNNCCLNLFDQSKSSSTVTTAASNENFSSFHTQSITNSYKTPGNESECTTSKMEFEMKSQKLPSSHSKNHENSFLISSGTDNVSHAAFNDDCKLDSLLTDTPSYGESSSHNNSTEKVIEIELLKDDYRKSDQDRDDCSCTKKYLPYQINEKNVWQVYETSDCKYIHTKHEIDEIFKPPDSNDAAQNTEMLHSRSNFSNQIICHEINHQPNHNEPSPQTKNDPDNAFCDGDERNEPEIELSNYKFNFDGISEYSPSFNIRKSVGDTCSCIDEEHATPHIDDADDNSSEMSKIPYTQKELSPKAMKSGKLLNRPKETNRISRDNVKPVEKEVQDEITRNGIKSSKPKTIKPIRLPSPVPKYQTTSPKRNNSYEDDSDSSDTESSTSVVTMCQSTQTVKNSPQNNKITNESTKPRENSSLVKQDTSSANKIVIPNIHQGWSVTVAGTHPDLAPDVEMKLSFPKAKLSQSSSNERLDAQKLENNNSIYYYNNKNMNNQLLPSPEQEPRMSRQHIQYDHHKPYYNNRRSLSLARIDSGKQKNHKYNFQTLSNEISFLRNDKTKILQPSKLAYSSSNCKKCI